MTVTATAAAVAAAAAAMAAARAAVAEAVVEVMTELATAAGSEAEAPEADAPAGVLTVAAAQVAERVAAPTAVEETDTAAMEVDAEGCYDRMNCRMRDEVFRGTGATHHRYVDRKIMEKIRGILREDGMTNEGTYGELKGGTCRKIPLGLARELL